jgi:hypothetical protein
MPAPAGTVWIGTFASDLMQYAGPKQMAQNNNVLYALVAAAWAEGRFAGWNPWDSTQGQAGAVSINRDGVKDYATPVGGIVATWETLDNGDYDALLAELRAGISDVAIARAWAESPWGTEPFTDLLPLVAGDWLKYGYRLVTGPLAAGLGI